MRRSRVLGEATYPYGIAHDMPAMMRLARSIYLTNKPLIATKHAAGRNAQELTAALRRFAAHTSHRLMLEARLAQRIFFLVGLVPLLLVSAYLAGHVQLGTSHHDVPRSVNPLASTTSLALFLGYLVFVSERPVSRLSGLKFGLAMACLSALPVLWLGPTKPHELDRRIAYEFFLELGLTSLTLMLAPLAVQLLQTMSERVLDWRRLHLYPHLQAFMDVEFARLALYRRQVPSRLPQIREAIARLERASTCIEIGLPKILLRRDSSYLVANANQFTRCAQLLREDVLALAAPDNKRRAKAREDLNAVTVAIWTGEYGDLPMSENVTSAHSRVPRLAAKVRSAIVGLLPISAISLTRHFLDFPTGTLANGISAFFALWAITTTILSLDPLYHAKLSAMKDLVSVVRNPIGTGASSGEP